MNVTIEKVIRMTRREFEDSISDSGVEFNFLKLNGKPNDPSKMGVKVSHREYGTTSRETAYIAQRKAYKNKIGPPVGKRVIIVVEDYYPKSRLNRSREKVYHGYETGICTMREKGCPISLKKKLEQHNLANDVDYYDGHNLGNWKGRTVLIDFGYESRQ